MKIFPWKKFPFREIRWAQSRDSENSVSFQGGRWWWGGLKTKFEYLSLELLRVCCVSSVCSGNYFPPGGLCGWGVGLYGRRYIRPLERDSLYFTICTASFNFIYRPNLYTSRIHDVILSRILLPKIKYRI